jgi:glycosyltransferase involved in cell wall biosynthesis
VEAPQGRLRRVLSGGRAARPVPGTIDRWPDRTLWIAHPKTRLFFHPRIPLPGSLLKGLNRMALSRLAREVAVACARVPFHAFQRPDLLWLGSYAHAPLLDRVAHRRSVAFLYDDLPASPVWTPRQARVVREMEQELLRRVDLAIFTSQTLLDSRRTLCRRALLLENAVSDEFFDESLPVLPPAGEQSGVLQRIDALDRPRIGYVGALNVRMDFNICRTLARAAATRGWHLVLAGPRDLLYGKGFDSLAALPNVHLPGLVPPAEVPHLLRRFDVLILPHVLNEFTSGMFPEKLPEYLATGKPIVSTRVPEVGRIAGEEDLGVRFVETGEAFVEACTDALGEDDPPRSQARIALARLHTRAHRLDVLEPALLELLKKK